MREAEGVIFFLFLDRARTPLRQVFIIVAHRFGFVFDFLFLLIGRTGGFLADFAIAFFFAIFGQRFRGRLFRKHGIQVKNFAQLHFAVIKRIGPVDDRVESDRAFAQAQNHGVATRLDSLGNSDFAFAGQQFHRAHFTQIHADGVIGAFASARFLDSVRQRTGIIFRNIVDGFDFFLGILLVIVAGFVILNNLHAHVVNRRHDVFNLFGRHLILRQGRI